MSDTVKNEVKVAPDVQAGFDLLFPEHTGHMLARPLPYIDLSARFTCSCGETLRVTILQSLCDNSNAFLVYLRGALEEWQDNFNRLNKEAMELGYMLVESKSLLRLIEKAGIKEGESF
jgi:hypothetical protein